MLYVLTQVVPQRIAQLGPDIHLMWSTYKNLYLSGMWNTIIMAVLGTFFGCIIGFICGVLQTIPYSSKDPILKRGLLWFLRAIIRIYVEVFRGTPMIIQSLVIFYGLGYFTDTMMQWPSIFACALIIVSINTGAYMAESVRGGFLSIDPGQTEGAKAIGMNHVQTMLYIIIPQSLRVLLPQIGNNLIINLKDTSVLFMIGYAELFSTYRSSVGTFYLHFPAASIVMAMYLSMTLIASILLRWMEKKLDGNDNYELVNEDQLVTTAGTYNHPGKGSPYDEHSKEAQKFREQGQWRENRKKHGASDVGNTRLDGRGER